MSYCVHCGVELDICAKKCALCNTPVLDPNIPQSDEVYETPFSEELHIPVNMHRRFIAYIITMIMLIPNIILFLVNICFFRQQHWSLYVLATTVLVWGLFVFPFYTKKLKPYLMWAVDTAAVSAYAYFFVKIRGGGNVLMSCIFTVIGLLAAASLILIIWLRRKKRHWTGVLVHILIDSVIVSFFSGFFISTAASNCVYFYIGIICSVCFMALTGFFAYCNRSKRIRIWLNKAFNL